MCGRRAWPAGGCPSDAHSPPLLCGAGGTAAVGLYCVCLPTCVRPAQSQDRSQSASHWSMGFYPAKWMAASSVSDVAIDSDHLVHWKEEIQPYPSPFPSPGFRSADAVCRADDGGAPATGLGGGRCQRGLTGPAAWQQPLPLDQTPDRPRALAGTGGALLRSASAPEGRSFPPQTPGAERGQTAAGNGSD